MDEHAHVQAMCVCQNRSLEHAMPAGIFENHLFRTLIGACVCQLMTLGMFNIQTQNEAK